MPNVNKRKQGSRIRGDWSKANLQEAINAVNTGILGINEASRSFTIPKTTLLRRIKANDPNKRARLGPDSALGQETERKLAAHIKKLQKNGFAPTRNDVRIMAYKLAEKMQIHHKFNDVEEKAGYRWSQSFLRRNPDIVVRKGENVSVSRSLAMSRDIVNGYFELLDKILMENDLYGKPENVYNADETGLQLNTRAGNVLAEKGSKSVPLISSGEKGETISVLACCNAEGVFIPPFSIFKGKNRKEEFLDGIPPGSAIYMSEKSSYVNSDIFFYWLKTHSIPRKMPGKVLPVLDLHASHTTNLEMLQYADQCDIILLCLPAHSTHYLQPLDRAFFKSLKSHYYNACSRFVKSNTTRKLSRLQFGKLLGEAWPKAANVENAISAFRPTGIVPYNPSAIPDYAYLHDPVPCISEDKPKNVKVVDRNVDAEAGTSKTNDDEIVTVEQEQDTPGKMLNAISPITESVLNVTKRAKGVAAILNSVENIEKRKRISQAKQEKEQRKIQKKQTESNICRARENRKRKHSSSSSEEEQQVFSSEEDSSNGDDIESYENEFVGCLEDYRTTKKNEDWIKCLICDRWLHEGCTSFLNLCQVCGKHAAQKK